MSGNLNRGIDQLATVWKHPDFGKRLHDGAHHNRHLLHDELRRAVLARDKHTCGACHYQLTRAWAEAIMLQVDHLVPVAAGGTDVSTNLRALCGRCNEEKSNRFTIDVRAVRPRPIVAYCRDDIDDEDGSDLWLDRRVFCAFCRALRSVDASWLVNYEMCTYLSREPAFTDMYTQRLLGIGRAPQWTVGMATDRRERWQARYLEVRASSRQPWAM